MLIGLAGCLSSTRGRKLNSQGPNDFRNWHISDMARCPALVRYARQSGHPQRLDAAADQAVAACGGDAREAVKALIVANHFLETDLEKLKAVVSMGYARGKLLPRHCRVIARIGMIEA